MNGRRERVNCRYSARSASLRIGTNKEGETMKLDIDLNKLSLDELDIVLKMAKKQAMMPETEEIKE